MAVLFYLDGIVVMGTTAFWAQNALKMLTLGVKFQIGICRPGVDKLTMPKVPNTFPILSRVFWIPEIMLGK